jgi:hypothetical protein
MQQDMRGREPRPARLFVFPGTWPADFCASFFRYRMAPSAIMDWMTRSTGKEDPSKLPIAGMLRVFNNPDG